MKKVLLVVLLVVCMASPALAVQNRVGRVFNAETIVVTESPTSAVFNVGSSRTFGAWMKLGTAQTIKHGDGSTANIDIALEQSYSGATNTWATSTTLIMDDWTDSEVASVVTISPSPMKYMRFKAIGNSANSTATTLTMYLFARD